MRQVPLPLEFAPIANLVNNVQRVTRNEYSSSCPKCAGTDRFRLFVVGKHGSPLAICLRGCGYVWTPASDHKPTKDEIEEWRKKQIIVEQARKEAAERALAMLQCDRMWEKFYAHNNEFSQNEWRRRGIADSWVKYDQLGLIEDYTVYCHGEDSYHSPAFTIPIWGVGGMVQNVKLRVASPRKPTDRYRNLYETGHSNLFIPLYDVPLSGAGVLVEGEFKGIKMEQALDDINLRVVGFQSKTPAPELFEQLKNLEPIYIWLDPDASNPVFGKDGHRRETMVERAARLAGKERCRIVDCPVKSDDGILEGLDPRKYLRMARRA